MPVRWSVVLLPVLTFLGAACSDGYPTEDVPTISPAEMTRSELLEKMNSMGDDLAPVFQDIWRISAQSRKYCLCSKVLKMKSSG
ncbi:hypothetical protein D3C87_1740760 [compost metagenome]